jgi:ABC-type amino acid transport substrate-binding protein
LSPNAFFSNFINRSSYRQLQIVSASFGDVWRRTATMCWAEFGHGVNASSVMPFAVGAYITAAYWFTASTSFANPAVALARAATDTFSGIRPIDVPGFVVAQLLGEAAATALFSWLVPALPAGAPDLIIPHGSITRE